jgi:hypothetical protein
VVQGNSATWGGGGVCLYYSDEILMDRNQILHNVGNSDSPGLELRICYDCLVCNNIIAFNKCQPGSGSPHLGGGILCDFCNAKIVNNTVFGNEAGEMGGGICCWDYASPELVNNIFYDNLAGTSPEIHVEFSTSQPIIEYNVIKGGYTDNNMDVDPMFVDGANGDFHLLYGSPCRDAGDNQELPCLDFECDPRFAYGAMDIGADEFYTHLYVKGDLAPGGEATLCITDTPDKKPVFLWVGTDLMENPIPTPFGKWYLDLPVVFANLGVIPMPDGLFTHTESIPSTFPPGMTLYLQAFVESLLTNPCPLCIQGTPSP